MDPSQYDKPWADTGAVQSESRIKITSPGGTPSARGSEGPQALSSGMISQGPMSDIEIEEMIRYGSPEPPTRLQAEGISSPGGNPSARRSVGPQAPAFGMIFQQSSENMDPNETQEFLRYGTPEPLSQLQAEGISSWGRTPDSHRIVAPQAPGSEMTFQDSGAEMEMEDMLDLGADGEVLWA